MRAKFSLCRRQRRLDSEIARHHPLDIAVDDHARPAKGNGCDRSCRVGPDAGQRAKPVLVLREPSAKLAADHLRGAMQVTGAGVIAEPGPGRHHILGRSGRKVADIRPAAGEIEEIGNHRGHHRLLQHDLGQPDMIGRRQVRPAAAPGKRAAMPVIPVENLLGGKVTSGHGAETDTAQIAVQRRAIGTTREEWSHLALCDNLRAAS